MLNVKKFIKIKRKTQEKQAVIKKNYMRGIVSALLWGFVLVMLVSSILFLLQFAKIASSTTAATVQIKELEAELDQLKNSGQQSDNLDVFNRYFIQNYYKTNVEGKAYQEAVKPYFSEEIELPVVMDGAPVKEIRSIQLWKKELKGKVYSCSYLVSYLVKGGEKETSSSELIHFLVTEKKGMYGVSSYPYSEQVGEFKTTSIPTEKNNLESEEPVKEEVKSNVSKWLDETFFPRYFHSTDLDDISYMMTEPVLLGNVQEYAGIDFIRVYPAGEDLRVKLVLNVMDRITQVKSQQEYSLLLKKETSTKYFVKNLYHTLGGNEDETN